MTARFRQVAYIGGIVGSILLGLYLLEQRAFQDPSDTRRLHPAYAATCRSLYEMFSDPQYLEKVDANTLPIEPPSTPDDVIDLCISELAERFEVR